MPRLPALALVLQSCPAARRSASRRSTVSRPPVRCLRLRVPRRLRSGPPIASGVGLSLRGAVSRAPAVSWSRRLLPRAASASPLSFALGRVRSPPRFALPARRARCARAGGGTDSPRHPLSQARFARHAAPSRSPPGGMPPPCPPAFGLASLGRITSHINIEFVNALY